MLQKIKEIFFKYFNRPKKQQNKPAYKTAIEYAVLIIVFLALRSSVFGNYRIPTGSMIPTLKIGDHLFANKLAYSLKVPFTKNHIIRWAHPKRGEVVSFKYPVDERYDYTKRVIGIPGDRLSLKDKRLTINGKVLPLTFVGIDDGYKLYEEDLLGTKHLIRVAPFSTEYDSFDEIEIPKGMYFCMGDNRDNSSDSRFWGFVPLENFDGRLGFRWIHIETNGTILNFLPKITKVSLAGFGIL